MCKTLIVDNFDSFTYNLFQYMGEVCGEEPTVVLNTTDFDDISLDKYDCIIISPGPGTPKCNTDVGVSVRIINEAKVPVLGVCLGHQCLAYLYGMNVVHAPKPIHGRISVIQHNDKGIFEGLPMSLPVVRYHSLVVHEIKEPFEITAWGPDGTIQGMQHKTRPLYGVQFHPESICTEAGLELLNNFRNISLHYKEFHKNILQKENV